MQQFGFKILQLVGTINAHSIALLKSLADRTENFRFSHIPDRNTCKNNVEHFAICRFSLPAQIECEKNILQINIGIRCFQKYDHFSSDL